MILEWQSSARSGFYWNRNIVPSIIAGIPPIWVGTVRKSEGAIFDFK